MKKTVIFLTLIVTCLLNIYPFEAKSEDFIRKKFITILSKSDYINICKKNVPLNGDAAIDFCAQNELQSTRKILEKFSRHRRDAQFSFRNCADNPLIKTYALMDGCMDLELKFLAFRRN